MHSAGHEGTRSGISQTAGLSPSLCMRRQAHTPDASLVRTVVAAFMLFAALMPAVAEWDVGLLLTRRTGAELLVALLSAEVTLACLRSRQVAGAQLSRRILVLTGGALVYASLRQVTDTLATSAVVTSELIAPSWLFMLRVGDFAVVTSVVVSMYLARRWRLARKSRRDLIRSCTSLRAGSDSLRLRVLKAELTPHFVGNALTLVADLLAQSPSLALSLVQDLQRIADRMRSRHASPLITLGEEVDGLAPFLAIERARLTDRLHVQWRVDDALASAYVPDLLVQPLVENAVRHGLLPAGGGQLEIGAAVSTDDPSRMQLWVTDDGVGLPPAPPPNGRSSLSTNVGVRNIRARLALLYGDSAELRLESGAEGGVRAVVELPIRWSADAAHASTPAAKVSANALRSQPRRRFRASARVTMYSLGLVAVSLATLTMLAPKAVEARLYFLATVGVLAAAVSVRHPLGDDIRSATVRSHAMAIGACTVMALGLFVSWHANGPTWIRTVSTNVLVTVLMYVLGSAVAHVALYRKRTWNAVQTARRFAVLQVREQSSREGSARRAAATTNGASTLARLLLLVEQRIIDAPQTAGQTIALVTALLRASLQPVEDTIAFDEEIALSLPFVELASQTARSTLAIEWTSDRASRSALVPSRLLAPLLEMVVATGFGASGQRTLLGRVRVDSVRREDELEVKVQLPGTVCTAADRALSAAIHDTRSRLESHDAARVRCDVMHTAEGGVNVTLTLPFVAADAMTLEEAAGG